MTDIVRPSSRCIEGRIRRLLYAHQAGYITDEECQAELAILQHRAEMLHPIPLALALERVKEVADDLRGRYRAVAMEETDRGAG